MKRTALMLLLGVLTQVLCSQRRLASTSCLANVTFDTGWTKNQRSRIHHPNKNEHQQHQPYYLCQWWSTSAASRSPWSANGLCWAPILSASVSSAPSARPTVSPSSLWAGSASSRPNVEPSSWGHLHHPRSPRTSGTESRPATLTTAHKTTAVHCSLFCWAWFSPFRMEQYLEALHWQFDTHIHTQIQMDRNTHTHTYRLRLSKA